MTKKGAEEYLDEFRNESRPVAGQNCGQQVVAAAGTAVQLHTNFPCKTSLAVKALADNGGYIYIGNNGGPTHVGAGTGYELSAGDVIVFEYVANLNNLWLDTDNAGDGVSWIILTVK